MSVSIKKSGQSVEFIGTSGQLCGSYHYEDMFKSFFRGLYTPGGKDVLACPPPEHLHHKGLLFGLCTSAANFWEEDEFTGTGFPRHFYLRYWMYRAYFPLMALGQFAERLAATRS